MKIGRYIRLSKLIKVIDYYYYYYYYYCYYYYYYYGVVK